MSHRLRPEPEVRVHGRRVPPSGFQLVGELVVGAAWPEYVVVTDPENGGAVSLASALIPFEGRKVRVRVDVIE